MANFAKGEAIGKKIQDFTAKKGLIKGLAVAGIAVAGVSIMDLMLRSDNKARQYRQEYLQRQAVNKKIRDRNNNETVRRAYNFEVPYRADPEQMALPSYSGLTQELFQRRKGHSNSWGGKKY